MKLRTIIAATAGTGPSAMLRVIGCGAMGASRAHRKHRHPGMRRKGHRRPRRFVSAG